MKTSKNSPEKILEKILELDAVEFLGICKIVGVDIYEDVECGDGENKLEPRRFESLWNDLCDKVEGLNRVRRRTLRQLIDAAVKKEK